MAVEEEEGGRFFSRAEIRVAVTQSGEERRKGTILVRKFALSLRAIRVNLGNRAALPLPLLDTNFPSRFAHFHVSVMANTV